MLRCLMRCLGGLAVCFLPLIAIAQSGTSTATASPSNNSSVTVLIHAADKRGNPVALSQTSLAVYVNRQQAQITDLKAANIVPVRFVLLLDLSRSDKTNLDFEKKAAAQIFEALSKKNGNEGYLGAFSHEIKISARPLQPSEVNAFLGQVEASGGTAMYDAIVSACDTLGHGAGAPSARRIVFLISDGEDNQSGFSEAKAINFAQHDGVAVFALATVPALPTSGGAALRKIAQQTGGTAVVLSSPDEFLDKLLAPLEAQYFLTFTPSPASPGTDRHLEVKSSDRSVHIFAPSGYASK